MKNRQTKTKGGRYKEEWKAGRSRRVTDQARKLQKVSTLLNASGEFRNLGLRCTQEAAGDHGGSSVRRAGSRGQVGGVE